MTNRAHNPYSVYWASPARSIYEGTYFYGTETAALQAAEKDNSGEVCLVTTHRTLEGARKSAESLASRTGREFPGARTTAQAAE